MKDQLLDLLERFSSLDIQELKYESKEFKLELSKENKNIDKEISKDLSLDKNVVEKYEEDSLDLEEYQDEPSKLEYIKSPMVGIFYSRMNPESEMLVEVGNTVKEGQVVCIIEAMKMFNEIVSPCDGVISKCNFSDGEMVAYDETIFVVETL